MKKLVLFACVTVLFLAPAAFADSIMCGKDVVNSGDTTAVVEYNCGKPMEKNATGAVERKRGYKHGVNEVSLGGALQDEEFSDEVIQQRQSGSCESSYDKH